MARIGVFICHCGSNIAGTVDIPRVVAEAQKLPMVVHAEDNEYTCSEVGQRSLREAIQEHRLNRVVIGACSPRMHENTFRNTVASAGLNPYLLEMANLREHASWVHGDQREAATVKAIDLIRAAVAKVARAQPLFARQIGVTKRALVIGGGIAGIQCALDIANAGFEVVLVERTPSIGGRMAQLDKTFPTLDCSACILTPKMVEVGQHPRIRLLTYAEVKEVRGFVGNFEADILQKARHVDHDKCLGCGICWQKCPARAPSEFDMGVGQRTAIYIPFAQAVPGKPVIDREHCRYQQYLEWQRAGAEGKKPPECRICEKLCPVGAIDWEQRDEMITEEFGAIVVATGYKTFDHSVYGEYGGGRYPDVITSLQLERLMSASGPTLGEVTRPSDGQPPKTVVFISCVGSRDDSVGRPYCSKVCCMYLAKQSIMLKEHDPEVQSYIFYIDIRAGGKNYEEFVRRAQEEAGTVYIRGRVSKTYPEKGKLIVWGEDSLMGRPVQIAADLVVLATGIEPSEGAIELAQTLHISYDVHSFLVEAHPKLRPVETMTDGVFLAGTAMGPMDIPDSVAQGSAAAAKVCGLLSKDTLALEPMVANVNAVKCVGCLLCQQVCPFKAIDTETLRDGRIVVRINEGLCKGCGLCVSACRPGAMNLRGFSNEQLLAQVKALTR
ncbi:MAG TPA: CoB--CoM heterodisulfide reductase iron-sulfur subunit A family protein [Dehalococcoidia bacterium]|nr:CoB--CoM heterodisulfide reductase iron-sulfur subunit A family protein [Dehalococcoidia bacterium]